MAAEDAIPVIVGRSEEDNLQMVKEIEAGGVQTFQGVLDKAPQNQSIPFTVNNQRVLFKRGYWTSDDCF